jgi:L-aspartate semialdehyde sulfurtransferase ferredoxin
MWKIDEKKCLTCGGCVGICPVMALDLSSNYGLKCDKKKCTECGTCENFCPAGAISVKKGAKND